MKVFFSTHSWLPVRYEGMNVYNHNLAQIMLSWGWEVKVCTHVCKDPYLFEGVSINPFINHPELVRWCDISVTTTMEMNKVKGKPVFVGKHNMNNEPLNHFKDKGVLFCANHVMNLGTYGAGRSFVWHPMNRYEGTKLRGDSNGPVLMVNCNQNKGGEHLIKLAKMMPHVQFMVVLGAYDRQIVEELPNVKYMPTTGDMSRYYSEASALLVLSRKEGSPTVVQEAMSFGLPIISYHLDGVKEVCKDGYYCNNLTEVANAINTEPGLNEPIILERDYEGLKKFFTV